MQFSDIFKIQKIEDDDWFDPILSLDTKLFIDPFLLYALENGSFKGSHEWIIQFFNEVFSLIAKSQGNRQSVLWKKAENLLLFPEVESLCLGYTGVGTSGLGSGRGVAKAISEALWEAVQAGVVEINHFEEIRLLREGVGADRISDATAWLILERLVAYTQEVCKRHNILCHRSRYLQGKYDNASKRWLPLEAFLPKNPYNKKSILLVPRKYLRTLPTIDPDEFWDYCYHNENDTLRNDYSYDVATRVDKATIISFAKRHPELRTKYLEEVEKTKPSPYDFEKDHQGLIHWCDETKKYCNVHQINFSINSPEDFSSAISSLIDEFKNYVENNEGWRLLWNEDGTSKKEEAAQLLFLGLVKHYCKASDIDISRETNIGRGPVDFKISKGYRLRVLLELKLAKNTKFWNGIEKQLPKYQQAEGVNFGYFIVIIYSEADLKKTKNIVKVVEEINQKTGYRILSIIIDARLNPPSASKL